jgi:hypothetical protein
MIFILSFVIIVIGLLSIFAKDAMWQLTQLGNAMKGVASERTEWWDTSTTIGGVVAVVVGIIGLVAGFRG